jgi:hypothetical protein
VIHSEVPLLSNSCYTSTRTPFLSMQTVGKISSALSCVIFFSPPRLSIIDESYEMSV